MTSLELKNLLAIPGHGAGGELVLCAAYSADRVMIGGEYVEPLRFEHIEAPRAFL